MKQTIRFNTFETNSSSTHSMIIIPDKYYKDFEDGKVYYIDTWNKDLVKELGKSFVTIEEVKATNWWKENYNFEIEKSEYATDNGYDEDDEDLEEAYLEEFLRDSDIILYDTWMEDYEHDETVYTTENGDTIHIVCAFGYGG